MLGRSHVVILVLLTATPAAAQRSPSARLTVGEAACQNAIATPDAAAALRLARQTRADALRAGDARGAACALYAEGHATHRMGAPDAGRLLAAATDEARRAGDTWTLTASLARRSLVVRESGDTGQSDALLRQALEAAAAVRGTAGREAALTPLTVLAHLQLGAGDPAASDTTFARLVREADALGVARLVGIGSYGRGTIALDRSDVAAALGFFGRAEAVARAEPPANWHGALVAAQARLDGVMGETDRAAARLRPLARRVAAEGQPGASALYLEQLGGIYVDAGRTADAVAAFRDAYDAVAGTESPGNRHKYRLLEARALFLAGQPDAARRRIHPAADSVVAAPQTPVEEALALLMLAHDARLGGRPADAAALAARSAARRRATSAARSAPSAARTTSRPTSARSTRRRSPGGPRPRRPSPATAPTRPSAASASRGAGGSRSPSPRSPPRPARSTSAPSATRTPRSPGRRPSSSAPAPRGRAFSSTSATSCGRR